MKNIHILPTDKPSLYRFVNGILKKYNNVSVVSLDSVHIYITNSEEIKERDYVICDNKLYKIIVTGVLYNDDFTLQTDIEGVFLNPKYCSKIILTDNTDLIADGVQSIDDDFLEWFCSHPSCEYIKTEKWLDDEGKVVYSREFPQEEPKRKIDTCYNFDIEIGCVQNICRCEQEVPKQETLEEHYLSIPKPLVDVSRMKVDNHPDIDNKETLEYGLLQHIKFCLECGNEAQAIRLIEKYGFEMQEQDKNMYSEEEVLDLIYKRDLYLLNRDEEIELELPEEWIKQFKNK